MLCLRGYTKRVTYTDTARHSLGGHPHTMFAPYAASRSGGSDNTIMPGSLPGLALVPACVGMAVAWTWVVATLFVGQELAMHDTSQSCMLGGAAAALAVFAMLDLAGTRGPEFNRGLMRVLSCLVAALIVVDIYLPGNPSLPAPLISGAWTLLGIFGAYAMRRSFHLLTSLATRLGGRSILRVACAGLASAAILGLMASNMPVQEAAVVMIDSVPVALWLLPQGRLMLGGKRRRPGKHAGDREASARPAGGTGEAGDKPAGAGAAGEAGNRPADAGTAGGEGSRLAGARVTGGEDARPQPTDAKGAEKSGTSAGRRSSLPFKQLAPYAFTFISMGFTCGFHTSVGRVLYIDYEHFNLVFLAMLAACTLCALLAKRPGFARRAIPAIALQIPLACACVAFVPLLFLSDRPDNILWELIQNTLVFLSSWSLLVAIALLTCADATGSNKMAPCATPYCAVGVATFALGLFIGWLVGQNSFAEYGASGMAFRLGVTACIALLVSSLLAASTHMADQAGVKATPVETSLASNTTPTASTENASGNKAAALACQAGTTEPATLPDSPNYSELAVEATQAGQVGCEAGTRMPITFPAEVEDTVNAGAAAHVQPLSHKTRVTPEGSSVPLSPAATGIQAAPCTPPCPTPCTCAIEAAVDSVALHFGLSEREHSLLMLLAEGLTAQQAADRLTVSRNTVKSHMAHIYVKCNVHTRAELNELLEAARRL